MYVQKYYILFTSHSTQLSSSWEANQFSDSDEIPHILLWNLKVHTCQPPVPIGPNKDT